MQDNYCKISFRKNEPFKSKGETQIARLLDRNNIKYIYEHPLALVDRGKVRTWYPDFTLPEYGVIVEYFGLNSNSSYFDRAQHKLDVYRKNGIEGIFLTENSFKGDWPWRITQKLGNIIEKRYYQFKNRLSS